MCHWQNQMRTQRLWHLMHHDHHRCIWCCTGGGGVVVVVYWCCCCGGGVVVVRCANSDGVHAYTSMIAPIDVHEKKE